MGAAAAHLIRRRLLGWSILALILLVTVTHWPLLLHGIPVDADDARIHLLWQRYYGGEIAQGHLFPRWLHQLNEGFGSPAFFLYPPFAHFISALTMPLFPTLDGAAHRLGIGACLAALVGAAGLYAWTRQAGLARDSALAGALIYTITPYQLIVDTYMRAAVAELWAFAWTPWIFLAMHLLVARPVRGMLLLTIAVAGLLTSHAPSSVFVLPACCGYALLLASTLRQRCVLWYTATGIVLALMVASGYLLPALSHQQYINTAALFNGYFEPTHWLFFSSKRWPSLNRELLFSAIALLQCASAVFFSWAAARGAEATLQRALARLSLYGTLLLLLAMSVLSAPLWEHAGILRKIQFPWRLLTLQTALLGLAGALYVDHSRARLGGVMHRRLAIASIAAVGFGLVNAAAYRITKSADSYDETKFAKFEPPEYELANVDRLKKLFAGDQRLVIVEGSGRLTVQTWAARHIVVSVNADTPLRIALRQFAYTGWTYRVIGTPQKHAVEQLNSETPILAVRVPPGSAVIELDMPPTAKELHGMQLSAAGALSLLLVLAGIAVVRRPGFIDWIRRKKTNDRP